MANPRRVGGSNLQVSSKATNGYVQTDEILWLTPWSSYIAADVLYTLDCLKPQSNTGRQLRYHLTACQSKWPPLIYVKVKCHMIAEIVRQQFACEIIPKSFDDIKHTEGSPVKISLFCHDTAYSPITSTYVHRSIQLPRQ